MGSPLAPVLANLFLGHHENIWLNKYRGPSVQLYQQNKCEFHLSVLLSNRRNKCKELQIPRIFRGKNTYEYGSLKLEIKFTSAQEDPPDSLD